MRRKEQWMFVGAVVLALGEKAVIKSMQENTLSNVDYVYYIECQVEGQKGKGKYHPNDVQELVIAPQA